MKRPALIAKWREALIENRGLLRLYADNFFLVGGRQDHLLLFLTTVGFAIWAFIWQAKLGDAGFIQMSARTLSAWGNTLLGVSVGVLGFLIAAFAILASMLSRTLVVQLSRLRHPGSDVSQYKFLLISNIMVLVDYGLITFGSAVIVVTTNDRGILAATSDAFVRAYPEGAATVNALSLAALGAASVRAVLQLRLFLKNLYQGLTLHAALLPEDSPAAQPEDRH